jgi:hypothetical protein
MPSSPIFTEPGAAPYRFAFLAAKELLRKAKEWRNDIEKGRLGDVGQAEAELEPAVRSLELWLCPIVADGKLIDPRDDPDWHKLPNVERVDIVQQLAQARAEVFSALGFSGQSAHEVVYKLGEATWRAGGMVAACHDEQTLQRLLGADSPLREETRGLGRIKAAEAEQVEMECLREAEAAWERAKVSGSGAQEAGGKAAAKGRTGTQEGKRGRRRAELSHATLETPSTLQTGGEQPAPEVVASAAQPTAQEEGQDKSGAGRPTSRHTAYVGMVPAQSGPIGKAGIMSEQSSTESLLRIASRLRRLPEMRAYRDGLLKPSDLDRRAGKLFDDALKLGAFGGPQHEELHELIERAHHFYPEELDYIVWMEAVGYLCPGLRAKLGFVGSSFPACKPIADLIEAEAAKLAAADSTDLNQAVHASTPELGDGVATDESSQEARHADGSPASKADSPGDRLLSGRSHDPSADGPVPPDAFRHEARLYHGLQPKPYRLVEYLWGCENRTSPFHDLAEPVWGDREQMVPDCGPGSLRRQANRFFAKHAIPYKVSIKNRMAALVKQPS